MAKESTFTKVKAITEWSPSYGLRICIKNGKRKLQQRMTRIVPDGDMMAKIEERWDDVPEVVEK